MWDKYFFYLTPLLASLLPLSLKTGRNLEYEYSLISSGIVLALFFLGLVYNTVKKNPLKLTPSLRKLLLTLFWFFFPGAILLVTNTCQCSSGGYLFWQTFHPLSTFLVCLGVSHISAIKPKWLVFGFVLIAALEAIQLWVFPQKRLLSLFWGFFHGPIYDREILLSWPLLIARASAVMFFASLTLQSSQLQKKAASFLRILLASCFLLSLQSEFLGHGAGKLNNLLSDTHSGLLYTLHYDKEQISKAELQSHIDQADFHTEELKEILKGFEVPKTHIYLYHSKKIKKLAFGANNTDVADVFTPSIHINIEDFPHSTLRHELVHSMTSGFAFHGLGFHPNMALTEGLAVALAPNRRLLSLDIGSGHLVESGRLANIESLFSFNFWKYSGSRAYTVAGSFLNYLIEAYGSNVALEVYSGSSVKEATNKPLSKVLQSWKKKITNSYDKDQYDTLSERLYRSPGILHSVCPHSRIDLAKKDPNFLERLLQPAFNKAEEDFQAWLDSLPKAGASHKSQEIISYRDIQDSLREIDAAMLESGNNEALILYNKVLEKTLSTYLGSPLYRALAVREFYLHNSSIPYRDLFLQALNGKRKLAGVFAQVELPIDPISSYLLMRWNEDVLSLDELKTLDRAFHSLASKNLYVEIAARSIAARSYIKLEKFNLALPHYEWLLHRSLNGEKEYFKTLFRFTNFMIKKRNEGN